MGSEFLLSQVLGLCAVVQASFLQENSCSITQEWGFFAVEIKGLRPRCGLDGATSHFICFFFKCNLSNLKEQKEGNKKSKMYHGKR